MAKEGTQLSVFSIAIEIKAYYLICLLLKDKTSKTELEDERKMFQRHF